MRRLELLFGAAVSLGPVACADPTPSLSYGEVVRGQVGAPRRFALPAGPAQISLYAEEADLALAFEAHDGQVRVVDRWATPSAGEQVYLRATAGATVEVRRARKASTRAGAFTLRVARADPRRVDLDARVDAALAQARAPDAASRQAAWPVLLELAAEARARDALRLAEASEWSAARTAARVGAPAWQTILPALAATATAAVRAEAHLELATKWVDLGLLAPAREHRQAGLEAAPRDPRVRSLARLIEARLAAESSRLVEARALVRQARSAAADAHDPALDARIAGVEGDVLVLLGDRAGASAAFEREFARAQAAGERGLERQALHHLGVILSNFDQDWEGASRFFERAVALAEQVGDIEGLASDLDALGEMASTLKRAGAVGYHRRALALRRASGSRRGEAQTLISLGSALARLRRPQEALPHLREGAKKMRALGNRSWEAYAYFRLGRALFKLEQYEAAAEAARSAIDIVESLRSQVGTEDGRAELMDAVRWYFDLYVSAAGEAHGRAPGDRWLKELLRASERARARSLLELITELDLPLDTEVPAALRAEVQETRAQIQGLEGAQRFARARSAPAAEVQALEVKIEAKTAEYAKLRHRVAAADPRRAALVATPLVTLEQVRDLLGPEAVAVELYLGAGGAYAVAIGTATSAVHALGPQGPIEAAARALHLALSARNRRVEGEDAARRAARIREADTAAQGGLQTLRRELVEPLSGVVAGARRVVVVPDGALHFVPFSALLPEHEVVTTPSLSVLAALHTRERPRSPRGEASPARVALIGDPVFGEDDPRVRGLETAAPQEPALARLRYAEGELDAIAEVFSREARVVRRGFAATRDWVVGGALGASRLVHFATHGQIDADEPARSGLVLSRLDDRGRPVDGELSLADIYGLRLSADLVTLSACETALGKEVRTEGLIGLTRGFLHAGARQVVASLWKVHDEATRDLMTSFYEGLARGRSPSAALRTAQQTLARRERFSAPYYWAGFVLQGDLL